MFLNKNTALLQKSAALARQNAALSRAATSARPYFSVFEKARDRLQQPLRHLQSFAEPDGYSKDSQMPEGYRMHGNTAASFSASLTTNAIELFEWHEMESSVHSQFGTVDNPVLIFTSDTSWRIVICMGPGIEDDSHAHEKVYYMVREGPINRCHICGQCFKLVRLKDEFSDENDYYSLMFSTLSHFDVSEDDLMINMTSMFGDRPQSTMQTVPATSVYIHVNPDERDRILVDPAYKLERTKEAHEKLYAMHESYRAIDKQMSNQRQMRAVPFGRDNYESWVAIEKSIRKFDRVWNKVEKFAGRKFSDPDNYERREKRMTARRNQRLIENYTYYFGGQSEEELQYRDYYETDIENDPEDENIEEFDDMHEMNMQGDFNPKLYDFVETSLKTEVHENFEDIIADKIFKYKYRQFADSVETYTARMERVRERFFDRALSRDASVEADLIGIYQNDEKNSSFAQLALDHEKFEATADKATLAKREYMVSEALQQYRDYFEDDAIESASFEYLDNLSNRDRIRFMEVFEDFSADPLKGKAHAMIQKREYNPELSSFNNLLLDLIDFKDRVRPLANDLALMDISRKYQSRPLEEVFGTGKAGFTQEDIDKMSPEDAARLLEMNDLVNEKYSEAEVDMYEAQLRAREEEFAAKQQEINEMFGIEGDDAIVMDDEDAIDATQLKAGDGSEVEFTDDEGAAHIAGIEELMEEMGLAGEKKAQPERAIGESTQEEPMSQQEEEPERETPEGLFGNFKNDK